MRVEASTDRVTIGRKALAQGLRESAPKTLAAQQDLAAANRSASENHNPGLNAQWPEMIKSIDTLSGAHLDPKQLGGFVPMNLVDQGFGVQFGAIRLGSWQVVGRQRVFCAGIAACATVPAGDALRLRNSVFVQAVLKVREVYGDRRPLDDRIIAFGERVGLVKLRV